jgi:CubicO group peptidase (beta-lactamase class C family)
MAVVEGECNPRFEEVKRVLNENLDSGADLGASVAVIHDGNVVVDIYGGYCDQDQKSPWQADTITNVWSSTKTMMALSALVLVDRGELDVDRPVASYWPEFGAAGKADIPVRDLLSHCAGLSGWQEDITEEDYYDHQKCSDLLAAQEPWWSPGSASGYHAITQGYLVGEVVKRVSGISLGEFFRKEIAEPLDADFYIGLESKDDHRVSPVVPPTDFSFEIDPEGPGYRTFTNPELNARIAHQEPWRRAEIPAANGHGNAKGAALAQAAVAHGGEYGGVKLLSPETIDLIFKEQANGTDLVLGIPLRFGIGYGLPNEVAPYLPDGNVCFWGGWGGSLVIVDTDNHLVFTYMMNRMGAGLVGDERGAALIEALYRAI